MKLLGKVKELWIRFKVKRANNKQKKLLLKALTKNEITFDDLIDFSEILRVKGFRVGTPISPYSITANTMAYGHLSIGSRTVYRSFSITAYSQHMKVSVVLDLNASNDDDVNTITIMESRFKDKPQYEVKGRNIFSREYIFNDSISIKNLQTTTMTPTKADQVNVLLMLLRDAFKYIVQDLINWS